MRLVKHEILNYKGIVNFSMQPGACTLIEGRNGTGKTSVLDSLRSMADGGKEPDSINRDAEEAMIRSVWEVKEGDPGEYQPGLYTMTRKITPTSYTFSVVGPDKKPLPSPAKFRDLCLPMLGFDPIGFDLNTDEGRAEALRKLLLVKVTAEEIRKRIGRAPMPELREAVYEDGIAWIEAVDKDLRAKRTDVNRAIAEREGMVKTMEEALAGRSTEEVDVALSTARKELAAVTDLLRDEEAKLGHEKNLETAKAGEVCSASMNAVDQWYAEKVAELQEKRNNRKAAAIEARTNRCNEIILELESALKALDPLREDMAVKRGAVTLLESKAMEAQRLAGAREQLEAAKATLTGKIDEKDALELAITALDQLRTKKMGEVQLEGISIRGGRLFIGDVLSSEVNTAARWMKWVEIFSRNLAHGQPLIVDNIEALDTENREMFLAALKAADIPVIAARVTDGPFEVKNQ